jgi:hypothetical protein
MPTPQELGWTESMKNGKKVYLCQGEETPRVPEIPCDLPQGWEHVRSRSKGTTYYKCAAGNSGKGISQWAVPTSACGPTTQASKKNSSKGAAPAANEKVTVLPNAASGTVHVNVNTPTGKQGFNVTPSQAGGKNKRKTRNKNRKNKQRKSRSRRV